jgi:hypothetical protein
MSDKLTLSQKEYDFAVGVLNDFYFELENNDVFRRQYCEEMERLSTAVKQKFPLGGRYLSYRLHDSRILSYKYIRNKSLEITFSDCYFFEFAYTLNEIEKLGMLSEEFVFPVTLVLNGLQGCYLYWCNRNEKLLPLKARKYLSKVHEIQNAEIQEVGQDYIKLGMEFWSGPTLKRRCPKSHLYIQVIFEQMSVNEQQKESLYQLFGKRYYPLLAAFSAEIDKGTYFDATVARDFIKANQHLIHKS